MGKPRRPTVAEANLYAEGAEFLVLGHLLIRGIHATKAYTRFPGWDILATSPETGTTCRIQVKSRLATDFGSAFPIKSLESDFVVLVALNKGYRQKHRIGGKRPPDFYVLPIAVVRDACQEASNWGTAMNVQLGRVPDWEQYRNRWDQVAGFVGVGEGVAVH